MPHPTDIHVGERLRALRILRGMSQTDVAEHLGLSFQQVQKYERGANRISASKLFEIATMMDVAPGYFFEGLGETEKEGPVLDPQTAKIASMIAKIPDQNLRSRIYDLVREVSGQASAA